MNRTVHVNLGNRSYGITIGRNLPAGEKSKNWKQILFLYDKALVPRFVLAQRLGSVVTGCDVQERALAEMYTEAICQE
jgi:hypothetical protein